MYPGHIFDTLNYCEDLIGRMSIDIRIATVRIILVTALIGLPSKENRTLEYQ
jgi:hypothetical protein